LFLAEQTGLNIQTPGGIIMEQPTATNPTKTTITPHVYTPESLSLERHSLPDGTIEYRNSLSGSQVEVETKTLSFMMRHSFEKFKVLLDILSEEDYQKFGHPFMSTIRDTRSTMEEAIHCIEQNVGKIEVSSICRNQFPYKPGGVIDARVVENSPS
jgi:hypothetical protein